MVIPCLLWTLHHIGSPPIIGIFPTSGASASMQDAMGMISNPSYMPASIFNYDNHMYFYERLHNILFWIWMRYITHNQLYPIHDEIVRKHFGSTVPSVYELEKRTDLFMIGTNWLFEYPHSMSPSVIYFHSIHMENKPEPLSKI
ncbi:hypothetical protein C0J52_28105 [Blattella germanica]|nr:hypothetical protein C0J52_28105 [Blattella germanica]